MESSKKNVWIFVGAVAILGVAGYMLESKYHWFTPASTVTPPPPPAPESKPLTAMQPRGKLPWAVGDVNLWDDENPDYCGNCAKWCNSSFSEGRSTQCDTCQSKCPNVRIY